MARTRLTPEREGELYAAVLDLLREVGYDALTMDAVAARTRSSKATLYRQWGSKPQLVARALRQDKPVALASADTGSLRGDFHAALDLVDPCQLEKDSALLRGVAHAAHGNPDLLQALRELLLEPEMTGLETMLRRAVERGEVRPDHPALKYVTHMLIGAYLTRWLIEERPVEHAYLIDYVDSVILPALGV
ncbi:TetR/AcrR family transcriptional regulator [Streptomyces sp. NPDC006971]|uniref:TetR/AcrR family transcriptional regulator n=1 Tax=Streptomyces sp. NPDC006971 TaxID=3154784 RepID=UPI0033D64F70